MVIEKSGFLLMAGTLAAGGVGGWLVHDSKSHSEPTVAVPAPPAAAPAVPPASVVVVEHAPPPPACDDNVGAPADCPAIGPSDEGMCSNVAATRCADFKLAFKPKVAQAAVACLRSLKPNEMCDPARVHLCGHSALMSACPDVSTLPQQTGNTTDTGSGAGATPVSSVCDSIIKSCANVALPPTMADCRQTLSGMTDLGRASMVNCMTTHCGDKGLLGCEALKKP
jgi:hypothetical protein